VKEKECHPLLEALGEAIRGRDQRRACAVTQRYAAANFPAKCLLDVLRTFAISEDGALHAEKYYRTASEEFARSRPSFRWRHLIALARVTASQCGFKAPGMEEARKVLKV
jgi:hypothetical protein